MPAYILAFIEVSDPVAYETYKALAPPAVAAAHGRYLARGGEVITLEGSHDGRRVVVLEFPSVDAAKAFYDGEAYRRAREARKDAARNVTFLLVPGVT